MSATQNMSRKDRLSAFGEQTGFTVRVDRPEEIMKKAIQPAIFKWRQTSPEL